MSWRTKCHQLPLSFIEEGLPATSPGQNAFKLPNWQQFSTGRLLFALCILFVMWVIYAGLVHALLAPDWQHCGISHIPKFLPNVGPTYINPSSPTKVGTILNLARNQWFAEYYLQIDIVWYIVSLDWNICSANTFPWLSTIAVFEMGLNMHY